MQALKTRLGSLSAEYLDGLMNSVSLDQHPLSAYNPLLQYSTHNSIGRRSNDVRVLEGQAEKSLQDPRIAGVQAQHAYEQVALGQMPAELNS